MITVITSGIPIFTNEPPHDKTDEMTVWPAKTQISLGIHPVWSVEVKQFTEITVHRGSVVTIRFTILFLQVSIRFGSLKCKQKLSINCYLDRQFLHAKETFCFIQIN